MSTRAEVDAIASEVSNWGRWGDHDELGTLNHITPDHIAAGAALVRRGVSFSLAIPLDQNGPAGRPGSRSNRSNPRHEMTATGDGSLPTGGLSLGAGFTDDVLHIYPQCATQWDALSHVHYDGLLYNGVAASTITMEGAEHHSITATASHFRSRGVLLDIARSRGVPALGESDIITADELENVADTQRVEIRAGDILLIRTGLIGTYHHTGSWERLGMPQPGLHYSVARWLHQRDIAAVAADNTAVEHITPDGNVPLHMLALRDLGMCLGEYWDLETLAADCASDGVYEFFLSAAGLPISRGVGSPVNPIALK